MEPFACLYVEKGEPYRVGSCLLLDAEETVLGRVSPHAVPDISFLNAFVSRRHLLIRRENKQAVLHDLGSKHGTEVNGVFLPPDTPYVLNTSDRIQVAGGLVVLRFSYELADQTLEIETSVLRERFESLHVDKAKRVCQLGSESIFMSDKEWKLFIMLYDQPDVLVTIEDIKCTVWPERTPIVGGVPDVGNDELSSLMYRLRKKLRASGFHIHAIRGTGYILEKTDRHPLE